MCYYNLLCIITRTNTFLLYLLHFFADAATEAVHLSSPPPRSRPHDSGGSGTPSDREGSEDQDSRSRIPETPRAGESSRGSTSQPGHMLEDDHDDCPYLVFDPNNPNVTWDGLPVIFPIGPAK